MSEEPKFMSRRELREAERAGLIQPVELPFDAVPRVEKAEVPIEPTGEALTRRQLRELEKTGGVLAIHTSQIELPQLPPETSTVSETWSPEPEAASTPDVDLVVAEREEPITVANPVVPMQGPAAEQGASLIHDEPVRQAEPLRQDDLARAEAVARAAQVASEFEAILNGAVSNGSSKRKRSKKFYLILTTAILLVIVGGLFIAAASLGILK